MQEQSKTPAIRPDTSAQLQPWSKPSIWLISTPHNTEGKGLPGSETTTDAVYAPS
jgi:hypothetical protein